LFIVVREHTKVRLFVKGDKPIDVDVCARESLPVLYEFFARDNCNYVGIEELPPVPKDFYSI